MNLTQMIEYLKQTGIETEAMDEIINHLEHDQEQDQYIDLTTEDIPSILKPQQE